MIHSAYIGDYAQVNHCCNQVVKYGDADYEDVSNAEKYADELMDSLLARRKETSLQVRSKMI